MDQAFGRYRLLEVIGQGGMGTVYRAHDTLMSRDVAIKVLPAELASQPGYRDRFRREAHTASRLTEPHIIPIYDTGEIDEQLYLAMPVIAGIDLQALLKRDGPMNPVQAVNVIEQMAVALDAAHSAGLVHRDVKPSNALLTSTEFVYLIDFGIAHDSSATRLTQTGSVVGTFAYMAPERFGAGTADARADVYALACVLFECLTGRLAFPGDSLEQQIVAHLTLDPPRPSVFNPAIPVGFDTVIAHGMAKNPDQRYQTAQQLASAARALTQAAVPPPWHSQQPLVPTYPAGPAIPGRSRKPWIIGGAATVAVVITAGVVAAIVGLDSGTKPPAPKTTSTTPAPMVASDRLDSILLSTDDINTLMGASDMAPTTPPAHSGIQSLPMSDLTCLGAMYAAQEAVYQDSGFTAISAQHLHNPGELQFDVLQAAVSFPSAEQATAFVTSSAAKWKACAGQNPTTTVAGITRRWTIGNLVGDVPTIAQLDTIEDGSGFACQHELSTVWNLVVDVRACSFHISDQAHQIADKMAIKATE